MTGMRPGFVLIHSPALGPRTWRPVAAELDGLGYRAAVPSLLHVADGRPPYWPRVVYAVRGALRDLDRAPPVLLVAHSNAGCFVPLLAAELGGRVAGCVLVDAAVPPRSGETPVVPVGALGLLRDKVTGGLLPRWTEWWGEDEIALLFPDEPTRRAVTAESPRLPLTYFEQSVPVPAGWDARPCAYLHFSDPYVKEAAAARQRGWRVEHLPGGHLHMLVDAAGVGQQLAMIAGGGANSG